MACCARNARHGHVDSAAIECLKQFFPRHVHQHNLAIQFLADSLGKICLDPNDFTLLKINDRRIVGGRANDEGLAVLSAALNAKLAQARTRNNRTMPTAVSGRILDGTSNRNPMGRYFSAATNASTTGESGFALQ